MEGFRGRKAKKSVSSIYFVSNGFHKESHIKEENHGANKMFPEEAQLAIG